MKFIYYYSRGPRPIKDKQGRTRGFEDPVDHNISIVIDADHKLVCELYKKIIQPKYQWIETTKLINTQDDFKEFFENMKLGFDEIEKEYGVKYSILPTDTKLGHAFQIREIRNVIKPCNRWQVKQKIRLEKRNNKARRMKNNG